MNVSIRLVGGHGRARYRQELLRYTDLEVAPLKVLDQCERFRRPVLSAAGSIQAESADRRVARSQRSSARSGEPLVELLPPHAVQDRDLPRLHSEFGEATRFTGALGRPESCDRDPNRMKQGTSLDGDGMLDSIQVCVRNSRDLHVARLLSLPFVRLPFHNGFRGGSIHQGIGAGSFSFSRRAWFLERKGIVPALQSARTFGTEDHHQHREAAAHATAAARASSALLIAGVIAFAVVAWWWLR